MDITDSLDFSVAICTYNGATRLPKVLDHLLVQTFTHAVNWEVIVIDNNSSDATAEVVARYQQTWPPSIPLRYGLEPQQGLGFARQHAVQMARAAWVGFLDDDNLPAPDWVEAAYRFGQDHPQAGVYGSWIKGCYEVEPPEHFHRISRFLAIGGGQQPKCYSHSDYDGYTKHVYPPGAGAVVRRSAWLKSVPQNLVLQGRISGLGLPGEDVEAFAHLRAAGWEIWYNPAMRVEHLIPKARLERPYLHKLLWRTGLSRYHTRHLAYPGGQFFWMLPLFFGNDLGKLLNHCYRHFPFRRHVVSDGELLLLLGSLVSPFYFLWATIRQGIHTCCFTRMGFSRYPRQENHDANISPEI